MARIVARAAALVGRDVIVSGNRMSIIDDVGQGGFELNSAADNVKVEVLGGLPEGAQLVLDAQGLREGQRLRPAP